MKWAWKFLSVAITDSSALKKLSSANAQCAPVHPVITSACVIIRIRLALAELKSHPSLFADSQQVELKCMSLRRFHKKEQDEDKRMSKCRLKERCNTMRGCKQTIFLFVLARNQTKAWARDLDATGSGQGNARERVGKRTQRRQLAKDDAEGQSTMDSRTDQSAWDRVQEQWERQTIWVRSSESTTVGRRKQWVEDQSRWVSIPRGFVEISRKMNVNVSLRTHKECSVNHPSCTWVDPSPYCLFALCYFSPVPSVVFLLATKKCVTPLSEPLDESPAKTELFLEIDKYTGVEGVLSQGRESFLTKWQFVVSSLWSGSVTK